MSLVHMADRGGQAHRLESVNAAYAQHDLLANAKLLVTAVERTRNRPVGRGVLLHVRVEQEQRHSPYLDFPQLGQHDAVRILDPNHEPIARSVEHGRNGHSAPNVDRGTLALPTVSVERLTEIPLRVGQAHPDERQTEITGRFELVASED